MVSKNSARWRVLFVLWLGVIAFLSLLPQPNYGPFFEGASLDKVGHFVLFFVFAFLALQSRRELSWHNYVLIIAGALIYGLTIEYAQLFIPGRFFDALDIFADTLGALSFFVMVSFMHEKFENIYKKDYGLAA